MNHDDSEKPDSFVLSMTHLLVCHSGTPAFAREYWHPTQSTDNVWLCYINAVIKGNEGGGTPMPVGNVHNAYPELPELPFARTTIDMPHVISYISGTTVATPVKRAAYVIFRNESAAGQKGINNNYIGLQADGARQADKWTPSIAGTCVHAENMTGRQRRFVCLRNWTTCIDILAEKIGSRGLYVGGYAHPYANMQINTDDDWPLAYWREWVQGDSAAQIPAAEKNNLLAEYTDAIRGFP